MVSTRERAGAAMAALDRRNPHLDDFAGLHWSAWVDRANILLPEGCSELEECSKYGKKPIETMTLRNEDMPIYGHCPAHDEFYLVVCSHCGQVVKPQAFEKHCERRHSALVKPCSQPSTLAPQQRPRPGRPPPAVSSTRDRQKDSTYQEEGSRLSASAVPQHKSVKAQKEAVSFLPMEISPQKTPSSPPHPSTPCARVPTWQIQSRPTSSSASPSAKHSLLRPVTGQSDDPQCLLRGPRTYSHTYKKVYEKECDLDKHCGVLDPERKKLCTQKLMCNIHSIHQQRKVLGRSKSFDQLVMEQRAGSTGHDLERHPVSRDPHTPKDTADQHPEGPEETSAAQHGTHNLGSSCSVLSRSRESLESGPEEDCDSVVEVEVQPPYPFNQSLLSSEESEDEEQVEARDLPATPWHPKPLGLCTFGSHALGSSIFTFDRRLHHLRFALSAMVEHHINTHLWKQLP
ncbi:ataxin-7-like protein 2b, partial [Lampris incognitus]|uniref:ataxin-7-like protein 2b n=1 Tax=Lampris incognitus TaxID=2546036 RepID=UPI0024B5AAB4